MIKGIWIYCYWLLGSTQPVSILQSIYSWFESGRWTVPYNETLVQEEDNGGWVPESPVFFQILPCWAYETSIHYLRDTSGVNLEVPSHRLQTHPYLNWVHRRGSDGKETAWNTEDLRSIPGSGRSLEESNGYPFQYFCLENSMDKKPGRL